MIKINEVKQRTPKVTQETTKEILDFFTNNVGQGSIILYESKGSKHILTPNRFEIILKSDLKNKNIMWFVEIPKDIIRNLTTLKLKKAKIDSLQNVLNKHLEKTLGIINIENLSDKEFNDLISKVTDNWNNKMSEKDKARFDYNFYHYYKTLAESMISVDNKVFNFESRELRGVLYVGLTIEENYPIFEIKLMCENDKNSVEYKNIKEICLSKLKDCKFSKKIIRDTENILDLN